MSAIAGAMLEAQEVQLVQGTWKELQVKEPDMNSYIHSVLIKYIEKNPNMKSVFKSIRNKSIEEVRVSAEFKHHAKKFASALDLVVQNITTGEQHQSLCNTLRDLGAVHARLGIRAVHYTPVGEILLSSLTETLGALFTEEVLSAWTHVYQLVVKLMTSEELAISSDATQTAMAHPASVST